MKGKPTNPCAQAFSRIPLKEASQNGLGEYVTLCECGTYTVLRVSALNLGRVAFGRGHQKQAYGVVPRHNRRRG